MKDQRKHSYNSEKHWIIHNNMKTQHTHTHTHTHPHTQRQSLIWSWVGSRVRQRLMKASHLDGGSGDEASWLLSKGPDDLWGLKQQLSASTWAPFNLPLLSQNTCLSRECETAESSSFLSFFLFFFIVHTSPFSPGCLVQPDGCPADGRRGEDGWRGV